MGHWRGGRKERWGVGEGQLSGAGVEVSGPLESQVVLATRNQ